MSVEPAQAFPPDCMDAAEWADWQRLNPTRAQFVTASKRDLVDRPCDDCPLGYAAEARARGCCNGSPGGVEEDEMDTTIERAYGNGETFAAEPRGLTIPRRISLDIAAPPCVSCAHEPVCALRMAVEGLATVETSAPPLPDGLRLSLTATVECSHFLRDKAKPAPVRVLTPQERGQANGPGKNRLSPETRARLAAGNTARAEARRAAKEAAAAG
jgi:hypothetical protein